MVYTSGEVLGWNIDKIHFLDHSGDCMFFFFKWGFIEALKNNALSTPWKMVNGEDWPLETIKTGW